ncbi:hypothetical protein [Blautia hominis]
MTVYRAGWQCTEPVAVCRTGWQCTEADDSVQSRLAVYSAG